MPSTRTFDRSRILCIFLLVAATIGGGPRANASILFEGYSKVLLSGAHVGFVIERYEFDENKKEFVTAYILKTTTASGSVMESLRARSSAALQPISYNYTSLAGKEATSIDATFKGEEMTMVSRTGNAVKTSKKKIKKGVFLSRFLVYLMLQSKEGIKTGAKYAYEAIAEEDGGVYPGEAFVQGREDVGGESTFKLLSKFKGTQFVGLVTPKGEVLANRSPSLGLASELVADPKDALGGQSISPSTLKMVFGGTPEGKENVIARKAAAKPRAAVVAAAQRNDTAATDDDDLANPAIQMDPSKVRRMQAPATADPNVDTPKKSGVPPGKGLILKPGAGQPTGQKAGQSGAPSAE